ncbi:gluconokinase [soil metagenome]
MTDGRFALGVDLGTGSARAFLFDAAGERRSGVRLGSTWRMSVAGAVEADADELVRLVCEAMDGALHGAPPGSRVVAVGFSALWHTILGVDERGQAVTPALGWNDARATAAARQLRQRLDERAIHARTGAMLHPSYPTARIAWLRDSAPTLHARVRRWLSVPEYLWLNLTGRYDVDLSIAAGSGLLNLHTLRWDDELLDVLGIDSTQLGSIAMMPDAVLPGTEVAAAVRWPVLREALWRMPVGDGACATVGSGCRDETCIALSIGTSAALRVLVPLERAQPKAGLWTYPLDRRRALVGGAISNGGLVRSWLRGVLRLPDDDAELDALLLARPPAAHGLTVLPFLTGERSPDWPLDATATFHGVRAATSALDMLQAGMEAVAYRLATVRRCLRDAVPAARRIVASGGALQRSRYWAQLLADVLGEPVVLCPDAETSSRGAALLALAAAGEIDAVNAVAADALPAAGTTVHPDAAALEAHRAAMSRHEALLDGLGHESVLRPSPP